MDHRNRSDLSLAPAPRVRRPAVCGYYYPEDPLALRETLRQLMPEPAQPIMARAVVVPHGSLRQSGAIAAAVLSRVQIPRRCVIVGPSHTGSAMRWSLMPNGAYRTPMGVVSIDEPLCAALMDGCPLLEADPWAQRGEHAVEVVLPFLQFVRPGDLSIVPLVTSGDDLDEIAAVARAVAQVLHAQQDDVLLIASSDLSHYEDAASGARKDQQLIDAMLNVDGAALARQIEGGGTTMCGYGAVACVLMASAQLGATRGELLAYGSSVESGGDPQSAIGYAGIVIS